MNYDVIIIGAGPGGIFAAYELMKKKPECKIAVFEEGYPLEKRKCPIDGEKIKSCINCKRCSIMCGFGGAGAFSDGKITLIRFKDSFLNASDFKQIPLTGKSLDYSRHSPYQIILSQAFLEFIPEHGYHIPIL